MAGASTQGLAAFLCPELIDAILLHVVWPSDVHTLALLSRWWHLCATPRLYATLPVLSSRPACTLALLLLLETDSARAACVRTVIFDERLHTASNADAHSPSVWRGRRRPRPPTETFNITKHVPLFPIGQYLVLRDVALALDRVLPALPNLRAVQMRHVHPLLMTFNAMLVGRSKRQRLTKPWRLWHNVRSYLDIFPAGETLTTWDALARSPSLPTHSKSKAKLPSRAADTAEPEVRRIERLSIRLWSRCAPPPTALTHLRTLSLTGAGFHDWSAARSWAPALAHLPALDALLLCDLGRGSGGELGELVVAAARLRTLVLHRVFVQAWEYRVLAQLVRAHAETLETLCLDVRWRASDDRGPLWDVFFDIIDAVDGGNKGYTWIRLPNLRTLRIHNLAGFECTNCALSIEQCAHGPAREDDTGLYDALLRFLPSHIGRHSLTELAITGLPLQRSVSFETVGRRLDRLILYGAGLALSTGPPPAGNIWEKERWLREFFLLRGTVFEGEYWDVPVPPRGRLSRSHPMQPVR